MRRLPLAYSCDRRWDELDGGDVVRRCDGCARDVVNLSALDEPTARTLLAERTTKACVRYRHEGGRIVFARRVRGLAIATAAVVLLSAIPAVADTATPEPQPTAPLPSPRRAKPGRTKRHAQAPAPKKPDSDAMGTMITPTF